MPEPGFEEVSTEGPPPAAPPPVVQPTGEQEPEREPASLIDKIKIPLMVSLLVSIIVIIGVGQFGGLSLVTKKDFSANIATMNTAIGEAKAAVDAVNASVEESLASIPSAVNTAVASVTATVDTKIATGIAGKADQANLNTVSASATNAATKVAAAQAEIDALKAQSVIDQATIATLQANIVSVNERLYALEEERQQAVVAAQDDIEIEVSTMGYALLPTSAANTTLSTSFRVDLTNTTTAKVEDLVLNVLVSTNVPQAQVTSWSLTGGGTAWQSSGLWYSGTVEFMNTQWGLNVDAGSTKRLYLTLSVVGNFPNPNYQYSVEVLN